MPEPELVQRTPIAANPASRGDPTARPDDASAPQLWGERYDGRSRPGQPQLPFVQILAPREESDLVVRIDIRALIIGRARFFLNNISEHADGERRGAVPI